MPSIFCRRSDLGRRERRTSQRLCEHVGNAGIALWKVAQARGRAGQGIERTWIGDRVDH